MTIRKLGPIDGVKLWLLQHNARELEKKVYNGTATKGDYEVMDRFRRYFKVLTKVR